MATGDQSSTDERVRFLLSQNLTIAVLLCLAVAAVGGYIAAGEYTAPDTRTEQRTVATWTGSGDFEHGAVVRNDTRAFDRGDVVQGRSVYFTRVMPILNGSYVYTHEGGAEPATVSTDLRLTVRSVRSGTEQREVLWQVTEPLGNGTTASLEPGEVHRVPFETNVTAQTELLDEIETELGVARGRIEVLVTARTDARTTLEGEPVTDNRTEQMEITLQNRAYEVAVSTAGETRESASEPVTVLVETDVTRLYGGGALAALGLLGAGGLVALDRRGAFALTYATRAAIRRRRERESFAEWISVGRVPDGDGRVVTVESLEDLVDVAIDSDRRVIEDPDSGVFVVLDGETRYEFDPGRATAGDEPDRPGPPHPTGEADPPGDDNADGGAGADDTDGDGDRMRLLGGTGDDSAGEDGSQSSEDGGRDPLLGDDDANDDRSDEDA
jgi:hypothetical protein